MKSLNSSPSIRCRIELLESRVLLSTYYVATNGSDTSPDPTNPSTPWKTIQKATTAVNAGDTVIVKPGVYYGPINLTRTGTAQNPITFKADAIAQNRVIITNASKVIREKSVTWALEDASLGMYSVPMDHLPCRVLYDGVDLAPYQTVAQLRVFMLGTNLDYPGAFHGWAYDSAAHKLYVRLHQDGKYGSTNPNDHTMAVSPSLGGGSKGVEFGSSTDKWNFAITSGTSAYVVLDGFSFETPGIACVQVRASDVTVRNCWFRGTKAGVSGGKTGDSDTFTARNVTIEYCDYSQFPTYTDVVEVLNAYAPWPTPLFWYQRKGTSGSPTCFQAHDYETAGIALRIGENWTIRNDRLSECFDGLSYYAMEGMTSVDIYSNVFDKIADNAIEAENHGQNIKVHNNEFIDNFMAISWQPLGGAPYPNNIYIYKNVFWQRPGTGLLWATKGDTASPNKSAGEPRWLKIGTATTGDDITLVNDGLMAYNNTVVMSSSWWCTGLSSNEHNVTFQNNIWTVTGYNNVSNVDLPSQLTGLTFSHNLRAPDTYQSSVGTQITGMGGQSLNDPTQLGLVDMWNQHFELTASSPARGLGIAVPGRPASEWSTDAGAVPFGQVWVTPEVGPVPTDNAPSNVVATTASTSQVDVVWSDNSTTETGFKLDYSTSSTFASGVTTITISTPNTTSYSVTTGLTSGTLYYFRVRAVLSGGSETANSNTANATTHPAAPTGFGATAVSSSQINLSWTAPAGLVTGYNIYRSTISNGQGSTPLNASPITGTTWSDTGLPPNTTYYYKVAAINDGGIGPTSTEASATTQVASPASYIDFDVASDYTGNFRPVGGYGSYLTWDASGVVSMPHTQSWRWASAVYDTTPADGQTTINTFGGTTVLEQHMVDFQINTSGMVKLFARVADPSVNGGYSVVIGTNDSGKMSLQVPTTVAVPDNQADLASTAVSLTMGTWYTLQLNVQNVGSTVQLSGKLFLQGGSGGTLLATVTYTHTTSPYTAAGQIGFAATSGGNVMPTTSTNIDNFNIGGDSVAPTVSAADHWYLTAPNKLTFNFSEPISGLTISDLILSGGVVATAFSYDTNTHIATYTLPTPLPDGNFTATLPAGCFTDTAGNPLASAYDLNFFSLGGDTNRDRSVTIADLGTLATNWQKTGATWADGDFNYDGSVTIADLGTLATNWQVSLPIPGPAMIPVAARITPTRTPMSAPTKTAAPTARRPARSAPVRHSVLAREDVQAGIV